MLYSDFSYIFLQPAIVAVLCVMCTSINSVKGNSFPTWKDKLYVFFTYLMSWFMVLFFIWLLMLANESWLALRWGVDLTSLKH